MERDIKNILINKYSLDEIGCYVFEERFNKGMWKLLAVDGNIYFSINEDNMEKNEKKLFANMLSDYYVNKNRLVELFNSSDEIFTLDNIGRYVTQNNNCIIFENGKIYKNVDTYKDVKKILESLMNICAKKKLQGKISVFDTNFISDIYHNKEIELLRKQNLDSQDQINCLKKKLDYNSIIVKHMEDALQDLEKRLELLENGKN